MFATNASFKQEWAVSKLARVRQCLHFVLLAVLVCHAAVLATDLLLQAHIKTVAQGSYSGMQTRGVLYRDERPADDTLLLVSQHCPCAM